MNCEHLRESIYDYLDDSLSPSDKADAERHLSGCAACREVVGRETDLAQSLSSRFEEAVDAVALDPIVRREMVAAVERKVAGPGERAPLGFWKRLALPFAAAAVILVVAVSMGHHFSGGERSHGETALAPTPVEKGEAVIHVSYSVPGYTFRREGNLVIDALTFDTLVADGALHLNNKKPQTGLYES